MSHSEASSPEQKVRAPCSQPSPAQPSPAQPGQPARITLTEPSAVPITTPAPVPSESVDDAGDLMGRRQVTVSGHRHAEFNLNSEASVRRSTPPVPGPASAPASAPARAPAKAMASLLSSSWLGLAAAVQARQAMAPAVRSAAITVGGGSGEGPSGLSGSLPWVSRESLHAVRVGTRARASTTRSGRECSATRHSELVASSNLHARQGHGGRRGEGRGEGRGGHHDPQGAEAEGAPACLRRCCGERVTRRKHHCIVLFPWAVMGRGVQV